MIVTTKQKLPKLKKWYLGSIDHVMLEWPQDGTTSLPIAYNQQIVEAHYGHTEMIQQSDEVTLVYVIPWDVREVRPPVMDRWQRVATTALSREYPLKPAEKAFVKTVKNKIRIDTTLLMQTLRLIKHYHGKNLENTNISYCQHALEIALIVLDYTRDPDTLVAALMHGIINETPCSLHQLALYFNPVIQRIVDGVSCVDSRLNSYKKNQLSTHEIMRKVLELQDERVLHIKLAIRLHYIRTVEQGASLEAQKKIAEETLQFFVPSAKKLRLNKVAEELQKYCLVVLFNKK